MWQGTRKEEREVKERDSAASQQADNVGYYYINSHYRNKMMRRFYQKINSTLKIFNRKYFER